MKPEEYKILKEQSQLGVNIVFFNGYAISIPAISYMEERVENIQGLPELPEMSDEEIKVARKKFAEIRKDLGKKLSIN